MREGNGAPEPDSHVVMQLTNIIERQRLQVAASLAGFMRANALRFNAFHFSTTQEHNTISLK
jgi:hypothetical protein